MRLTLGIFSIVLSVFVIFQSIIAGVGNLWMGGNEVSGMIGIMIAVVMLVSGILTVAARNSRGTHLTAVVFWVIAGVLGFLFSSDFKDLNVWGALCIVFALLSYIYIVRKLPKEKNEEESA
ncbi:hypothetical protein [Alteribacillus sp. HJP-4]|uniref:hypothetical protein n=1 Tax=Alteribacillus sp. HJP-4 TaxID=2775394 RepID=UPI0035CCE617